MTSCITPKVTASNIANECSPAITQLIIIYKQAYRAVLYEDCLGKSELLAIKWYKGINTTWSEETTSTVAFTAAEQFLETHNGISSIPHKDIKYISYDTVTVGDRVICSHMWELTSKD